MKEFSIRPAAKGYHHNYLSGLLKHTVGLMRIAHFLLKQQDSHYKGALRLIQAVEKAHKEELWSYLKSDMPLDVRKLTWKDAIDHLYSIYYQMMEFVAKTPNYSQLICSIFFHDLGKILEYHHAGKGMDEFQFLFPSADRTILNSRKPTGITMDEFGALIGHIPLGIMIFTRLVEKENISILLEDQISVLHNIAAHHGKMEWGSSTKPQTLEAWLIHFCDFLDSRYDNSEAKK